MNENLKTPNTEELLDRSLEHYRAAEPRPGLEQRVLAELEAAPVQKLDWNRWLLPLTASVLAAVLLFAFLIDRPGQPTEITPSERIAESRPAEPPPVALAQPVTPKPVPATATVSVKAVRKPAPRPVVRAAAQPPRLSTFPTPRPLSEQERLLLGLVQSANKGGSLAFFVKSEKKERLTVSAISIRPLEIRPLGARNTELEEQGEEGEK